MIGCHHALLSYWNAELNLSGEDMARDGIMRVNVLGSIATVLRETNQELGWCIALSTPGNPMLGPEKITFSPKDCFSFLNGECTFETLPSLKHAGIDAHPLCIGQPFNIEDATYLIHHDDKEDMLLSWSATGGSGGYSQE